MSRKYEIVISERADNNLKRIFDYLELNWSIKVKNNFKKDLEKEVKYIRENPYIFPVSNVKDNVRRCLITKHNAMYYRILGNVVEIITIQDTRSKPNSLIL